MKKLDVSYEFYFGDYGGGKPVLLEKDDFDRCINRAVDQVQDYITFDGDYPPFQREIKLCACRVAEALFEEEPRRGIKSENTDGFSVTFSENRDPSARVRRIVTNSLKDTGLIYAGVSR